VWRLVVGVLLLIVAGLIWLLIDMLGVYTAHLHEPLPSEPSGYNHRPEEPEAPEPTITPEGAPEPAPDQSSVESDPADPGPAMTDPAATAPGETDNAAAGPAPLPLQLPIACTPGSDCWVVNYVDRDPGPGRRDFMCLDMSYDGHKGTDFALANEAVLAKDVPVLAAAGGTVQGVRDGMDDVSFREIGRDAIQGRECGNGVRLDHGDGWATQYCHLKKGSILVGQGQRVEAGQVLGAVGLSGLTEFPHVHLQVSRGQEIVDPFVGVAGGPECGRGAVPLWDASLGPSLEYRAPKLVDLGFTGREPTRAEAEAGAAAPTTLPRTAPALILWLRAAGVRPGDRIRIEILGPDGSRFLEQDIEIAQTRIMTFLFRGRRTPDEGWPAGRYTGRVSLSRDRAVTGTRLVEVELTDP